MRRLGFGCMEALPPVLLLLTTWGHLEAQQIKIAGRVTWQDRRGSEDPNSTHAARDVRVEVCEVPSPNVCIQLATTTSDSDGRYEAAIPQAPVTRAINARARSISAAATVHAIGTQLSYILPSIPVTPQPGQADMIIDIKGTSDNRSNAAFSVLDSFIEARAYVSKMSGTELPSIDVEFPTSGSASYFKDGALHILFADKWDWDVTLHEYGHYVSKRFALDDNPRGPHGFDENLSDRLPKGDAVRLAWAEGWPTYFSIAAQLAMNSSRLHIPNVGDSTYSDTEDESIDLPLDSDGNGSLGEDNEVSVMRILFDSAEAQNRLYTNEQIWSLLVAKHPVMLSEAVASIASGSDVARTAAFGAIQSKHKVAPLVDDSSANAAGLNDPPTLVWTPNGGGIKHPNNTFMIDIYDRDMKELVEIPNITTSKYQVPALRWNVIKANADKWVVRGSNLDAPTTGPFFSGPHAIPKP